MTAAAKTAMESTFNDVRRLICHTAMRFRNRSGGDLDELTAVGFESFMKAYATYNRECAEFSTWVSLIAWQAMSRHQSRERRHQRRRADLDEASVPCTRRRFSLADLVAGLSADAAEAVRLALAPPEEVSRRAGRASGVCAAMAVRSGIRECLRDAGWSAGRLREAFQEVRRALEG